MKEITDLYERLKKYKDKPYSYWSYEPILSQLNFGDSVARYAIYRGM